MVHLVSRKVKIRIVLAAILVAVCGVILLSILRRTSVIRKPNSTPNIEITIATNQPAKDLAEGIVHFTIRNLGKKPVSLLIGGDSPYFGIAVKDESVRYFYSNSARFLQRDKKDFRTLKPLQDMDATLNIFKLESVNHDGLIWGTYTGQVFYDGVDVNDLSTFPSDIGSVAGPMVTFRVGWLGNTIL